MIPPIDDKGGSMSTIQDSPAPAAAQPIWLVECIASGILASTTQFKTLKGAYRVADRLNAQYGGHGYRVVRMRAVQS